ncbi:hypothetical protein ACP4OV_007918 [Aristida adscensionis]
MEKKAWGTAAPAARRGKRRRRASPVAVAAASPGGAGMCDDVVLNIFARLPARDAVAAMALSTHHRRLVRSPDFRSLHRRLGPPLPRPHIAYLATAWIPRSCGGCPVTLFHGFRVAGAGAGLSGNGPRRELFGGMYLGKQYVNTCNGVVLLAGAPRLATCVLWNPAVADADKEVTVPVTAPVPAMVIDNCAILGLGYGRRSNSYKLLLSRTLNPWHIHGGSKELLVCTLGVAGEQPPLRTLVLAGLKLDGEISKESLYIDGTIYLLYTRNESVILAFNVDDETVTAIDMPGKSDDAVPRPSSWRCQAGRAGHGHWHVPSRDDDLNRWSVAGAWDCGGVILLHLDGELPDSRLYLYHVGTKKMFKKDLPPDRSPESTEYKFCWGYKPALVSPGSIAGEISQDENRRRDCTADIVEAWNPVNEQDKRKGHEAMLDTVCFMEFLVRIMRKLPDNMQDVIEMPLLNS